MLHKTTQSSSYICILLLRQTSRLLVRCQDRGGYGTSLIREGPARRPWEKTTMVVVRGQGALAVNPVDLQPVPAMTRTVQASARAEANKHASMKPNALVPLLYADYIRRNTGQLLRETRHATQRSSSRVKSPVPEHLAEHLQRGFASVQVAPLICSYFVTSGRTGTSVWL